MKFLDTYHGNEYAKVKSKREELERECESLEYIGSDYHLSFRNEHEKAYKEWKKYYEMELNAYIEMYLNDPFRWENDKAEFYRTSKKRHFDREGNEIKYDAYGNREHQFINLKTGEAV
jgi:hypothetical protein